MQTMLKKFRHHLTIRTAKKIDIPQIISLQKKSFDKRIAWNAHVLRMRLNNDSKSIYLVVYQGIKLVAFMGARFNQKETHVICLIVDKKFQHRHIATDLMNFVLELAAKRGSELVSLEVSVDNIAAQKLYDSLGFKKMFIRKNYYCHSIDAINMVYWLTDKGC